MNLSIRLQNKEALIPYNGLYIDDTDMVDKGYVTIYSGDCKFKLGTYKSKERALEVLDEIQNLIKVPDLKLNERYEQLDLCLKSLMLTQMTKIYEMPKE